MRIGAIVFDPSSVIGGSDRSVVSLTGGWASIGGTPARRIQGIAELPNDVIWLTNLGYTAFLAAKLNMHANFRNEGWLRTAFEQIATEFGLGRNTGKAKETAEVLSLIAHRVVAYSCKELNIQVQSHARLNDDYATAMGLDRCRIPEMHYSTFETIAGHPNVSVIQSVSFGRGTASSMTLRCNRLAYARRMLSNMVPPDTGWELVKQKLTDADLERMEKPFLVRCRITNVKPIMAEALSWGGGSKLIREWLTDVEWRIVRQYADVELRAAMVCEQGYESLDSYAGMLPQGTVDELSYSLGLVAEQVWTALMNKQPCAGRINGYPARAAWLRAIDRMQMFDYAQRMQSRRGVTLISYGMGNVVVRVPEGGAKHILDMAVDVGLMPPMAGFIDARTGVAA